MRVAPAIVASLLAVSSLLADPAPWPQANGPFGNYTPRSSNVKLLDDAAGARQLWLSEDSDMGYAKGSASGYLPNLARWPGHPGSSSGPILAEGKIFVTTFRPSGDARAEKQPGLDKFESPNKPYSDEELARFKLNMRILADDICIAIDAKTGRTVWKAVEEGRGLNRYMGKRQGFCVSPAYHDGVVFSMGTTGLLYAYRASDGTKLWETNIGKAHEAALEHKARSLEKQSLPGGMGWDSSLTVAGGVLIVPLFEGKQDMGLRGINVKDGKTLWEVPLACSRHATPCIWTHEGKQYVLTATVAGALRLIEPATGNVLWTVEGLGQNHCSLIASERHVFVNVGTKRPRKEDSDQMYGLLGAYAITPKGAKLAWKLPDEPAFLLSTWMDSCARRFYAVADGKVYYCANAVPRPEQPLYVLDEDDGKVLAKLIINSPALQFYPAGDRLLTIRDASHSETELAFIRFDGKELKQLTEFWHPPHMNTTAYEVYMEFPFADGKLYLRTKDGRVACYDLSAR